MSDAERLKEITEILATARARLVRAGGSLRAGSQTRRTIGEVAAVLRRIIEANHPTQEQGMKTLATTLREELALNAHNDDEGHMRCTCDDCIATITEDANVRVVDRTRIAAVFKELDEASYRLPIPKDLLKSDAVERFSLAKHHVHVLLNDIASPPNAA